MKLILTIAWRNILRHKGKSLVIGTILFLGAFLMTLGNGVISGMNEGVRKHIVEGFMGDIVLISEKQKSDNILLEMMGTPIESFSTYKQIRKILEEQPIVERFLPVGKNMAMVLNENDATPGFAFVLGADLEAYQKMFPNNSKVLEGRFLEPGEKGMLVPTFAREQLYDYSNIWVLPENGALIPENMKKEARENLANVSICTNVVLMGMSSGSNSSTDIRFSVKGILKYPALNTIFGHFCIADIESYRECMGYFSPSEKAATVPKEEKELLDMQGSDLDSLFTSDSILVSNDRTSARVTPGASAPIPPPVDIEDGAYNAVFIKLKDGVPYQKALEQLDRALSEGKTGVRAVTWNKASGPIGSMALIIKSALFIFVTMLFFVAVIIIVNTLSMAALERTSEIGMMRAVGARKSFIGGMFLGETAILAVFFGGAGILLGILTVEVIPLLKITSANDMVQILYGGDVFNPILSAPDILLTVGQLATVTLIAALYPMRVARNITPLDAVSRD